MFSQNYSSIIFGMLAVSDLLLIEAMRGALPSKHARSAYNRPTSDIILAFPKVTINK